ncbi:hypothetical protein GALL_544260 [mine drainage metagenome]|uniref:Uncharacterized protein n=1 Tax=mine drainage metagenome TaxID=410659 RepID=A0A1J5NZ18_9ZZZZ
MVPRLRFLVTPGLWRRLAPFSRIGTLPRMVLAQTIRPAILLLLQPTPFFMPNGLPLIRSPISPMGRLVARFRSMGRILMQVVPRSRFWVILGRWSRRGVFFLIGIPQLMARELSMRRVRLLLSVLTRSCMRNGAPRLRITLTGRPEVAFLLIHLVRILITQLSRFLVTLVRWSELVTTSLVGIRPPTVRA